MKSRLIKLLFPLLFTLTSCININGTSFNNTSNTTTNENTNISSTTIDTSNNTSSSSEEILKVGSIDFTYLNETISSSNLVSQNISISSLKYLNLNASINLGLHFDASFNNYLSLTFTQLYKIKSISIKGYCNDEDKNSNVLLCMDDLELQHSFDYIGDSYEYSLNNFIYTNNISIYINGNYDFILEKIFINFSNNSIIETTNISKNNTNDEIKINKNSIFNLSTLYSISPTNANSRIVEISVNNDDYILFSNHIIFLSSTTYTVSISFNNISLNFTFIINEENYDLSPKEQKYKFSDADDNLNFLSLESIGNQKVLVIPVQFEESEGTNYSISNFTELHLSNLNEVFNGEGNNELNKWESLKSYYYKSSFSQLNLDFVITDCYIPSFSAETYESLETGTCVKTLLNEIYDNGLTINNESIDFKNYDLNSDGYIDGVWLIYNNFKNLSSSDTVFWAYKSNVYSNSANLDKPNFNLYANAAYSFITRESYKTPLSARVLIHETGHMLGLNDYYSSGGISPLGCNDMMSYNLGDQNCYSKFILQWISPKVVYGNSNISLSPSTEFGDSILLKCSSTFNNSPFDEYIMIEYYAPTNLNYYDATTGSVGYGYTFSDYGIRVYHVDARLIYIYNVILSDNGISFGAKTDNDGNPLYFDNSTDSLPKSINNDGNIDTVYLFHSNLYDSYYQYEIEAITKTNTKLVNTTSHESNSVLFKEGDIINKETCSSFFKNGYLHNGNEFNYNIVIKSMTNQSCELNITLN